MVVCAVFYVMFPGGITAIVIRFFWLAADENLKPKQFKVICGR